MMSQSAENDAGLRDLFVELQEHVIDGMTVPPGGPDDDFWRGAQWAYGQVREALSAYRISERIVACEARVWNETLLVAAEEIAAAADAHNMKIDAIAGNSTRPRTFDTSTAHGMRRTLAVLAEMRERGYPE